MKIRTHTHKETCSQSRPMVHAFGLLEETRAPGGNPHQHGESMQTTQKGPSTNPGNEPILKIIHKYCIYMYLYFVHSHASEGWRHETFCV